MMRLFMLSLALLSLTKKYWSRPNNTVGCLFGRAKVYSTRYPERRCCTICQKGGEEKEEEEEEEEGTGGSRSYSLQTNENKNSSKGEYDDFLATSPLLLACENHRGLSHLRSSRLRRAIPEEADPGRVSFKF